MIRPNRLSSIFRRPLFALICLGLPLTSFAVEEIILTALEEAILLAPGKSKFLSSRASEWDKATALKLAGTLVYAAGRTGGSIPLGKHCRLVPAKCSLKSTNRKWNRFRPSMR